MVSEYQEYDMAVSRRISLTGSLRVALAVAFIFAVSSLSAQVHGVPASATSLSPQHGFHNPPGVPASATSLGPQGFTPKFDRFNHFNPNFRRFGDGRLHQRDIVSLPAIVPTYWYPYVFPNGVPDVDLSYSDQSQVSAGQQVYPQQPMSSGAQGYPQQAPQVIIIDNRGVHDATQDERAALAPAEPPAVVVTSPAAEESRVTTLVIFRDGTRKELLNYAIMGKEFIDLSNGRMRRYPLSDVDVQATIKENNERGVDFRLPPGQ
jgi:hypothetical protein